MNEDSNMSGPNESSSHGTPERRILGELGNSNPDSPTANLRLLTALASSLKSASDVPCQGCSSGSAAAVQLPVTQDTGCVKLLPRKEKSLSLLCNKFLNLFPLQVQGNSPKEISLNTTAQALGTEKRRIYDIINVLESLEMATKAGKNQYYWHGQSRLPMTLAKLKMSAIELGLEKQIQDIQKVNRAYIENDCHSCSDSSTSLMVPQSPVVDYCFPEASVKEDKSLGLMCRKFVMLFLVSMKNGVINLDIAGKVLINEQDNSANTKTSTAQSRYKTKVRRLYDIANVLSAIGLIEKVDLYNCIIRKPIFRYTGPVVDCINFDAETPSTENTSRSLVGMTTPNKKSTETFKFRTLSRISRIYSSTPVGTNRETRKRKLFDSDNKFERTRSSPCLNTLETRTAESPKNTVSAETTRTSDGLDDSILHVVEMELKRMKSSENKPKVCTKLFPRHNSDSCIISPAEPDVSLSSSADTDLLSTSNEQSSDCSPAAATSSTLPALPVVSKENLVSDLRTFVTPVRTVRINVPLELKIAPFTMQQQQQRTSTTPKFVKLSKLDMKKLVPVSKEDIRIKLAASNAKATVPPAATQTSNAASGSSQKPNIAILTRIPNKKISPGDTFRAVKVGDTFQLVPIERKSDSAKEKK